MDRFSVRLRFLNRTALAFVVGGPQPDASDRRVIMRWPLDKKGRPTSPERERGERIAVPTFPSESGEHVRAAIGQCRAGPRRVVNGSVSGSLGAHGCACSLKDVIKVEGFCRGERLAAGQEVRDGAGSCASECGAAELEPSADSSGPSTTFCGGGCSPSTGIAELRGVAIQAV